MGFPTQFLNFLTEYYEGDNISTASAGKWTKPQYQKRGLRQGCNLSSILFILYLTGLSTKLDASGKGAKLKNKLLNHLFFADDIFLAANSTEELQDLKKILEEWCLNYKMLISSDKTQIIAPDPTEEWSVNNLGNSETFILEHVNKYPYLGIKQYSSPLITSNERAKLILKKLSSFRKLITMQKFFIPDTVDSYLTMWKNVLLPSVLYGVETLPFSMVQMEEMELEQRKMGKILMGVAGSTANEAVEAVLGLKPIQLQIAVAKMKLYKKASNAKDSSLLKTALSYHKESTTSLYIIRLKQMLKSMGLEETLENIETKDIENSYKSKIRSALLEKKSLYLMPIPKVWWKKLIFMQNSVWSRTFAQFLVQNAGLGNRTDKLARYGLDLDNGRILKCPLCKNGNNNEIHLVIDCNIMNDIRTSHKLLEGESFKSWLNNRRQDDSLTKMREFMGGYKLLSFANYLDRGLFLMMIRRVFFERWSDIVGETVECSLEE